MTKKTERPNPPPGIYPDYREMITLGTHGPIGVETSLELLRMETEQGQDRGTAAFEQSWTHLREISSFASFARATSALREATRVYPVTQDNWHSGERIPLIHAWEVASESVLLALRSHYKSAYQRLRETLEMVVLQLFFYTTEDKSIVPTWGRGETRTPSFRAMLRRCATNELYAEASKHLGIEDSMRQAYDDLSAYIHTLGVPATSMGLRGSNILSFSPAGLERFCGFYVGVARLSVLMLGAFFPPTVIPVPAFRKMGHFDPGWLPRKDHVDCICGILAPDEIRFLRHLAEGNTWFQGVVQKLNQLPDLTQEQTDRTYDEFQEAVREGLQAVQELLKKTNALVE